MRSFVVATALVSVVLAGCSDDDGGSSGPEVDVDSEVAKEYLAELEAAGLGDLFTDDAKAVEFVATACTNAQQVGQSPEALIESGAVNQQSAIALKYCDTELAG